MDRDGAGIGTRSCLTFRLPHHQHQGNNHNKASSIRYSDGARKKVSSFKSNKHRRRRVNGGGGGDGDDDDDIQSSLLLAQQSTYHLHPHPHHHETIEAETAWESFPSVHDLVTTTSQQQQQQQQHESNPAAAAAAAANSTTPFQSLLIPPTPVDRSPQTMLAQKKEQQKRQQKQQQQQQRSRGLYEGEMEPDGVRGQEAVVMTTTALEPKTSRSGGGGAGEPIMRISFGGGNNPPPLSSSNRNTIQIVSPVSDNNKNNKGILSHDQQQQRNDEDDDDRRYGYRSASRVLAHHDHVHISSSTKRPQTPPTGTSRKAIQANGSIHKDTTEVMASASSTDDIHVVTAGSTDNDDSRIINNNNNVPARDHSDTESTASDDDIRHMLPDLLPSSDHEYRPPPPPNVSQRTEQHLQRMAITSAQVPPSPQSQFALSKSRVVSPDSGSSNISSSDNNNNAPSVAAQRAAAAAAMVAHEQQQQQQPPPPQVSNDIGNKNESPNLTQKPQQQQQQQQQYDQDLEELNQAAMEHVQKGEYDAALAMFGQVLRMHRTLHGEQHPSTASAHHNLGTVYAKRASVLPADSLEQRTARALALESFQAAARSARDSLGPNHPNVAVSLVRIGFLLLQSKQYKNAIVTFLEALRIRKAHFGDKHALVANLHNNLGVCYMHLNDFEHGKGQLEQALQVQRYVVEQADPNNSEDLWVHYLELADTLFNIGGLCLEWIRRQGPDSRRADDAEDAFAEALEVSVS